MIKRGIYAVITSSAFGYSLMALVDLLAKMARYNKACDLESSRLRPALHKCTAKTIL